MLKDEENRQKEEGREVKCIRKVQMEAEADKEIISGSVMIKDGKDIVGMVSYEPNVDMVVIRYFLYDTPNAGTDIVVGICSLSYKKRGMKEG
jgi:hypothetical protein